MPIYIIGGHLGSHLEYLNTPKDAKLALFRIGFSILKLVRVTQKTSYIPQIPL